MRLRLLGYVEATLGVAALALAALWVRNSGGYEAAITACVAGTAVLELVRRRGAHVPPAPAELKVAPAVREPHSVELTIADDAVNISPVEHEHNLQVVLTNRGTTPIQDWYAELEFPTRLLRRKHTYAARVPERSNASVSLFRWTQQAHVGPIYPGDPKTILKFIYAYDSALISDPSPVLDATICVRVYVESLLSAKKSVTVKELRSTKSAI